MKQIHSHTASQCREQIQNCNHEQVDTRIVAHVVYAPFNLAFWCIDNTMHYLQDSRVSETKTRLFLCILLTQMLQSSLLAHSMINQTPIDTWDLSFGMDKLCRFYHINAICASLGTKNHEHYLSLTFWGWLWSQFGWHCRHIKTSLTHLCIWLVILTSCWMLMQTHSRTSKDLLSFCTTKPVV